MLPLGLGDRLLLGVEGEALLTADSTVKVAQVEGGPATDEAVTLETMAEANRLNAFPPPPPTAVLVASAGAVKFISSSAI